jgi:hypothetical protein
MPFLTEVSSTHSKQLFTLFTYASKFQPLRVISNHVSQKDARNIEQGFAPSHRNVNYLQDTKAKVCIHATARKDEGSFTSRLAIKT